MPGSRRVSKSRATASKTLKSQRSLRPSPYMINAAIRGSTPANHHRARAQLAAQLAARGAYAGPTLAPLPEGAAYTVGTTMNENANAIPKKGKKSVKAAAAAAAAAPKVPEELKMRLTQARAALTAARAAERTAEAAERTAERNASNAALDRAKAASNSAKDDVDKYVRRLHSLSRLGGMEIMANQANNIKNTQARQKQRALDEIPDVEKLLQEAQENFAVLSTKVSELKVARNFSQANTAIATAGVEEAEGAIVAAQQAINSWKAIYAPPRASRAAVAAGPRTTVTRALSKRLNAAQKGDEMGAPNSGSRRRTRRRR